MKKFSILFFLVWLYLVNLQGQNYQPALSTPWGNNFVHYYDCGGQETHDYIQDFLVYKIQNLTNGMQYVLLGQSPSVFDNIDYETINTACFEKEPYPSPYMTWNCSSPGTDTVVLIIGGANEHLVAGSSEWIPFTIRPPAPWSDASSTVKVSVVAPYYISGQENPLICSSPVSFNLENVPSTRTSVLWQILHGSSVISSGNGNTASASISSNGNYQVIFTMHFECGLNDLTYTRDFHFGPYSSSDYPISGPSSAQCNSYVYYNMPQLNGVSTINWTWPNGWTYISGQNSRYLALRAGTTSGGVGGRVNNDCGQGGSYAFKYTTIYGYCGYSLIISPNPASDIINILIKEPSLDADTIPNQIVSSINDITNYKITITDKSGIVYSTFTTSTNSFSVPIQNLKKGNYIITANNGKIQFSSQFVVNR